MVVFALAPTANADDPSTTVVSVEDNVWLYDVKKLGINLGAPDQYGSSQLLKNIILNPGFEAGEFGTIFLAYQGATSTRLQQDNWDVNWNTKDIGQPPGFWDGAEYEIISGPERGTLGTVTNFVHEQNRYTYQVSPQVRENGIGSPEEEDVVLVRKEIEGFEGNIHPNNEADVTEIRPGSPGKQSLKLIRPSSEWQAAYTYYMDSYWRDGDPNAGKLMLINGNWHFEIWAKGLQAGDELLVTFRRQGETPFMQQTLSLDRFWQKYEHNFYVAPDADPLLPTNPEFPTPVIEFTVHVRAGTETWIDDVELSRTDYQNPTVFTDKVFNLLQELEPGILRNWGNQLGSSLDNQLSEPWARRSTAHSPRDRVPENFHYSLHEFLELCQALGAEPWYVVPPTFTKADLLGLVAYLSAESGDNVWADRRANLGQVQPWTDVFPIIHLEYGNEMWGGNDGNDQFIGATMRGGERLGDVVGERIAIMKSSPFYGPDRFNFIIGGQYSYPERQLQIENSSQTHDTIALAPYFGTLDHYDNDEDIIGPLFARPHQDVRFGDFLQSVRFINNSNRNTDTAIYEINFHTTEGDAPIPLRTSYVTGLTGGVALPLYMLSYQKGLGIKNQAAFQLSQFSFQMDNETEDYVSIWGLMRDLEATGNKRPTWLGLELANRAIQGDMLVTTHSQDNPEWVQEPINAIEATINVPYIQSFAFRDGDSYSLALFNLHRDTPQNVVIRTPKEPDNVAVIHELASNSIYHHNEAETLVRIFSQNIENFSDGYELELPPFSFYVVEWGANGVEPVYIEPSPSPVPQITPSSTPQATPIVVGGGADGGQQPIQPTEISNAVAQVEATMTASAAAAAGSSGNAQNSAATPPTPTPIQIVAAVTTSASQQPIVVDGPAATEVAARPTQVFVPIGERTPGFAADLPETLATDGSFGQTNRTLFIVAGSIAVVNVVVVGAVLMIIGRKKAREESERLRAQRNA